MLTLPVLKESKVASVMKLLKEGLTLLLDVVAHVSRGFFVNDDPARPPVILRLSLSMLLHLLLQHHH